MAMKSVGPIFSRIPIGLNAHCISIECHIAPGLPGTTIVGLAEGAVKESRDRVKSALRNNGFNYPNGHVIINLAPGNLAKSGTGFDLPIALAILQASGQVNIPNRENTEFIGELGLFGELRPINGILTCALASSKANKRLVMPAQNEQEASLVKDGDLLVAPNLSELIKHLSAHEPNDVRCPAPQKGAVRPVQQSTYGQIIGQLGAKKGLLVAAAGGHHLIMLGPPGAGKTMLARSFIDLLPTLSDQSSLEVATIYSSIGLERSDHTKVPFRDPHHSISSAAMVGGGQLPQPGEVALAHKGVLFLDELPHFKPATLDLLREPIETGHAVIARAKYRVSFPCDFQLIAAMNPCPAGRSCKEDGCRCGPSQVQKYRGRVSGPLLDRIDLHVQVPELDQLLLAKLQKQNVSTEDPLPQLKEKVIAAMNVQLKRQGCLNVKLSGKALGAEVASAHISEAFLEKAIEQFHLSARSYHKIWRIARTLADLDQQRTISEANFLQALNFRSINWEADSI